MSIVSLDKARLEIALARYGTDLEPLAGFLHRYFCVLQEQGFTREEALRLTDTLQDSLLRIIGD